MKTEELSLEDEISCNGGGEIIESVLNFVDLAGSERINTQ